MAAARALIVVVALLASGRRAAGEEAMQAIYMMEAVRNSHLQLQVDPVAADGVAQVRLFTGKDVTVKAFEFALLLEGSLVPIAKASVGPNMERWTLERQTGLAGAGTTVACFLDPNAAPLAAKADKTEARGVRGASKEGRVIASLQLARNVSEGTQLCLDQVQVTTNQFVMHPAVLDVGCPNSGASLTVRGVEVTGLAVQDILAGIVVFGTLVAAVAVAQRAVQRRRSHLQAAAAAEGRAARQRRAAGSRGAVGTRSTVSLRSSAAASRNAAGSSSAV